MGIKPGPQDVLIGGWVFICLATVLVVARIYLRLKIQRRKLLLSDGFMLAAWVSGALAMIIPIRLSKLGALDKGVTTALTTYTGRPQDIPTIFKLIWAANVPYWTTVYLCKAALLTMYLGMFPAFMQKRRALLWGTIIYNSLAFVASILIMFLICLPLESNWDLDPHSTCPVSKGILTVQMSWALSMVGDILVFILPFTIIHELNIMSLPLKLGVYFTFLLGIINITVDTLRFAAIMTMQVSGSAVPMATIGKFALPSHSFKMPGESNQLAALWGTLDTTIAVVIACLPSLRPYFSSPEGKHPDQTPSKRVNTVSSMRRLSEVVYKEHSELCGETTNSVGSRDSYQMHHPQRASNSVSEV